jgi:hypothetical protein
MGHLIPADLDTADGNYSNNSHGPVNSRRLDDSQRELTANYHRPLNSRRLGHNRRELFKQFPWAS